MSPSTRRAWIEMMVQKVTRATKVVALHPEGVDRNTTEQLAALKGEVALHPEGVDRNGDICIKIIDAFSRPPPGGRG